VKLVDIGARIKEIRKSAGLTQQRFADRIGLKRNTVGNYEINLITPSDRTIADICREFNVSEVWLRTGEGDQYIKLDEDAEFIQVCEEINLSDDSLIKQIIKTYWRMNEDEKAAVRKLIDGISQK
jgi:transcriptional regulator with XRE-family HTH domain